MDNQKLIRAVDEYFSGFLFRISADTVIDVVRLNDPDTLHRRLRIPPSPAEFVSARMTGAVSHEDLEIKLQVEGGRSFTITYPRDYLTPARDFDEEYELEYLIAENIVFQVDETICGRTLEELNGHSIVEFWG